MKLLVTITRRFVHCSAVLFIFSFSSLFSQSFPDLLTLDEILKDPQAADSFYESLKARFKNSNFDEVLRMPDTSREIPFHWVIISRPFKHYKKRACCRLAPHVKNHPCGWFRDKHSVHIRPRMTGKRGEFSCKKFALRKRGKTGKRFI